jgi:hypothetical protein
MTIWQHDFFFIVSLIFLYRVRLTQLAHLSFCQFMTMWQIFCKEIGKRILGLSDGLKPKRSVTILEVG